MCAFMACVHTQTFSLSLNSPFSLADPCTDGYGSLPYKDVSDVQKTFPIQGFVHWGRQGEDQTSPCPLSVEQSWLWDSLLGWKLETQTQQRQQQPACPWKAAATNPQWQGEAIQCSLEKHTEHNQCEPGASINIMTDVNL